MNCFSFLHLFFIAVINVSSQYIRANPLEGFKPNGTFVPTTCIFTAVPMLRELKVVIPEHM